MIMNPSILLRLPTGPRQYGLTCDSARVSSGLNEECDLILAIPAYSAHPDSSILVFGLCDLQ